MIEVGSAFRQFYSCLATDLGFPFEQRGLLDELDELWQIAQAASTSSVDYSKGIYQAIGAFDAFSLSIVHFDATAQSDCYRL